jgi:hypothetical protein
LAGTQEDRTVCIREAGLDGTPSYVELQTCLEMAEALSGNAIGASVPLDPEWGRPMR